MNHIFATRFSHFAPPPNSPAQTPPLPFVDPLFKRRLSQVSRMTIQVVHDVLQESDGEPPKLVFVSFRGELGRQLKINRGLVKDAEVTPANFSLSVFNTPPAVATIALGMRAGYTAVFPGDDDFYAGLLSACAPVLSGAEERVIFAYADEAVPDEYRPVFHGADGDPLAFACVLSAQRSEGAVELDVSGRAEAFFSPRAFLSLLCPS